MTELRLAIALVAILTLPGWAILAISDSWRHWDRLQRWCVAIGISIAVYPVLFYGLRAILPFVALGPYTMGAFLALCAGAVLFRMRRDWRDQIAFDRLEWSAIAIFGMTIFSRYWIILDHPYPAWSDSLHHVLLTLLTATHGQLPTSMQPYAPIPLDMYHLGLYALSASTQWLAHVEAHTALLWTAQALNALCGVGVYLVLDRKLGRFAGVVGALVAGLLCHQPSYYVNWGRFTQVSAQSILLIGWVVTWEAVSMWRRVAVSVGAQQQVLSPKPKSKRTVPIAAPSPSIAQCLVLGALAGLLNSAVFLLHFRVAGFYLPLLAITLGWECWQARKEHRIKNMLAGSAVICACSLIFIFPTLWPTLRAYAVSHMGPFTPFSADIGSADQIYYRFPWEQLDLTVAHRWLLYLAGFSALVSVVRRNKLVLAVILWLIFLTLEGNAYLFGLPILRFTNMWAILILCYLPISLIIGCAAHDLVNILRPKRRAQIVASVTDILLLLGLFFGYVRTRDIDPSRYFLTRADVEAMSWIKANTPPQATFAINTYFAVSYQPSGSDGGYWIPYFTGRMTTASCMMFNLSNSEEYNSRVLEMSQAAARLGQGNAALEDLRKLGVDYVYIGQRGNFSGNAFDPVRLNHAPGVTGLYNRDGVYIFGIR